MYDISLVVRTSSPADTDDLQTIVREFSQIKNYIFESHPDVTLLKPLEDKVSISIDQVHGLHANLSLSPVMGVQKVLLIHPAHALTLPAQQAMLKLLEEPPSKVLFILVTHTPYVLLPTILSRCKLVFPLIQGETAEQSTAKGVSEVGWHYPKNHAEAIKISDEFGAKKDTALAYIHNVIATADDPHVKKAAIKALGFLNKNINAKLVLDEFLFSILP